MLELNRNAVYVLAVRIQQGEVLIALFDLMCNIVAKISHPFDSILPEQLASVVSDTFDYLCSENQIDPNKVLWCGVATPGLIDSTKGVIVRSSNLHWHNVEFEEIMTSHLENLPVCIVQNANAAALAELERGSGQSYENFIYLNLSVGISAAFILEGKIYKGEKGYAGEIGHSILFPKGGPACVCGKKGCFEAVCGVKPILERVARELGLDKESRITIEDVVSPPLIDNDSIRAIITEAGHLIGLGIANLLSLFNPELVILGGSLARAGSVLTQSVMDGIREFTFEAIVDGVQVVNSSMVEDPQLVGAAVLALQHVFSIEKWERIKEDLMSLSS